MSKRQQAISKSRKKQILEESFKEGAVSSEVARKYGIRQATLYSNIRYLFSWGTKEDLN